MIKNQRYYDGDRLDKNNRASDRFLFLNSCGVQTYRAGAIVRTVREKGREDYNLIYVESGILEAEFEGEEAEIHPGGFLIYPPHMRQDYQQHGGTTYYVRFTGTAAEELLQTSGLLDAHSFQGKHHDPRISRLISKMLYHYVAKTEQSNTVLIADLIELISVLETTKKQECLPPSDSRLRTVILRMNQTYADGINLDTYANAAGISRSRFMHLFKEVTGTSPYAYVLEQRMIRAAELLLSSDDPVSQISYLVGFSDPLHFSRLFKKKYGLSPEHFRKKQ